MVSLTDGSQLVTGAEVQLFAAQTALRYYTIWIFLNPMVAADEFTIRIYVQDAAAGTERLYSERALVGVQSEPSFYLAPILMDHFRVTIQKIAGTDRTFLWRRGES